MWNRILQQWINWTWEKIQNLWMFQLHTVYILRPDTQRFSNKTVLGSDNLFIIWKFNMATWQLLLPFSNKLEQRPPLDYSLPISKSSIDIIAGDWRENFTAVSHETACCNIKQFTWSAALIFFTMLIGYFLNRTSPGIHPVILKTGAAHSKLTVNEHLKRKFQFTGFQQMRNLSVSW